MDKQQKQKTIQAIIEKKRPKDESEFVGHQNIVKQSNQFVKTRRLTNILMLGEPGNGKTSWAWILAWKLTKNEKIGRVTEFNASDDRGIETMRGDIKDIIDSDGLDVIILDEGEYLTPDALHTLRRMAEQALERGKIFIITANTDDTIIDAILSRFKVLRFGRLSEPDMIKRAKQILEEEGINYSNDEQKQFLTDIIHYSDGDLRKALIEIFWFVDENNNVVVNNEHMLFQHIVDEYKDIFKRVVLNGSFYTVREDLKEIMYYQTPGLKPWQILNITEEYLHQLYQDKKLSEHEYVRALKIVKDSIMNLAISRKNKFIQIIGMLADIRIIYTQGVKNA